MYKLLAVFFVLSLSSAATSKESYAVENLSLFADQHMINARGYSNEDVKDMIQSRDFVGDTVTTYAYYDRENMMLNDLVFCDNVAGSSLDCWGE